MTKREKILLFSGFGLLVTASLLTLIVLLPAARPTEARKVDVRSVQTEAPVTPPPAAAREPASEAAFILRDLNGYIAVYRLPEIGMPDMVTGIDTRTLRQADYLSLQTGIRVEGWDNLQMALEDFGS